MALASYKLLRTAGAKQQRKRKYIFSACEELDVKSNKGSSEILLVHEGYLCLCL